MIHDSDCGVTWRDKAFCLVLFMCSGIAATKLTEVTAMYGNEIAPVVATTTTAAAVALPSTGGDFVVTLAVSVATGLVAWGVLYARSAR